MTSALSRAIEKAMETDVEYRRGLPVNISSFMGTGIVSIDWCVFKSLALI